MRYVHGQVDPKNLCREFVERVLTSSGRMHVLGEASATDTLWHYTSVAAFQKIVTSKRARFHPLEKMNDSQEGRWLRTCITQMMSHEERARVYLPFRFLILPRIATTFIFSLSGEPDRLSQWRAYGDSGKGVAVGFSKEGLRKCLGVTADWNALQGHMVLAQVTYHGEGNTAARELLNVALDLSDTRDQLSDGMPESPRKERAVNLTMEFYIGEYHRALGLMEPLFKNVAFSEENEWRAVLYVGSSGNYPEASQYDIRNGDLIPFYDFDIGSSITALKLGPTCPVHQEMARGFCLAELGRVVDVSRSSLTLVAR
jgi:hypothetical protein